MAALLCLLLLAGIPEMMPGAWAHVSSFLELGSDGYRGYCLILCLLINLKKVFSLISLFGKLEMLLKNNCHLLQIEMKRRERKGAEKRELSLLPIVWKGNFHSVLEESTLS